MKAHRFDAWSFVGGLVLIVFGLLVLIPDSSSLVVLRLDTFFDFVVPVLALIVGVAMVVPALRRRQPEPSAGLTREEAQALDELNNSTPPVA